MKQKYCLLKYDSKEKKNIQYSGIQRRSILKVFKMHLSKSI